MAVAVEVSPLDESSLPPSSFLSCKGVKDIIGTTPPWPAGEARWRHGVRCGAPLRERGGAGGPRERERLCPLFGDRARYPEVLLEPTGRIPRRIGAYPIFERFSPDNVKS